MLNLVENPICARIFYAIFSTPIMVVEEIMLAYKTLQRSRQVLGVLPHITIEKPRTLFGVKCSTLPKSTELTKFVDIAEMGDVSIMADDRSRSV